jgi:hypothetical protein
MTVCVPLQCSCNSTVILASALSVLTTALLATVIFVLVQVAVCKCRPKFSSGGAETGTSEGGGEGQFVDFPCSKENSIKIAVGLSLLYVCSKLAGKGYPWF